MMYLLTILHYGTGEVHQYRLTEYQYYYIDAEEFITELGYNLGDISYMYHQAETERIKFVQLIGQADVR